MARVRSRTVLRESSINKLMDSLDRVVIFFQAVEATVWSSMLVMAITQLSADMS